MAQTYAQLQKQIDQLQRQANKVRDEEASGVIERIKHAIAVYGLTPEQLGFGALTSPAEPAAPAPRLLTGKAPKPLVKSKKKSNVVGFGDASGNVWSGRGPHPAWLRQALQAGHSKNEFRIGHPAQAAKTPLSLSSAGSVEASPTTGVAPPANVPASASP